MLHQTVDKKPCSEVTFTYLTLLICMTNKSANSCILDGKMIVSLCADAWMHQHTETLFSNDAAYD